MFELPRDLTWRWPVAVQQPADGGVLVEKRFDVRFRLIDDATQERLIATDPSGRALLREAIVEVFDVVIDGAPAVGTAPGLVEQLINVPYVRVALLRAHNQSVSGHAAAKN